MQPLGDEDFTVYWQVRWSPDGQNLFFQHDETYQLMNWSTREVTPLIPTEMRVAELDWSPDGKWLAFSARPELENKSQLYLMDYTTREIQQLTYETTRSVQWAVEWLDSQRVFYIMVQDGEQFPTITKAVMNIDTKQSQVILPDTSLESLDISPDGREMVYNQILGNTRRICILTFATGQSRCFADIPQPFDWSSVVWRYP